MQFSLFVSCQENDIMEIKIILEMVYKLFTELIPGACRVLAAVA